MPRLPALLVAAIAATVSVAGPAAAYDPLVGGPAERELLKAVRAEKFIRAREKAAQILRRRPGSFIGRYALARAYHDEEANLPRALFHIRRIERWLRQHYGDPPKKELARSWHRKLLLEEEALLGELDRREEQLQAIERHDAHYRPRLDFRRIWALMKLHRFKEAKRVARKVAASKHQHRRVSGLNGMIAIEMERFMPQACYRAGVRGVQATGGRSCILLHNTAEAAFAVFKFNEVEKMALKALQATIDDCPNSSYPHLANLFLLRADFQRAMEAVKKAREQGVRRRYRQQFEAENTGWLFRLLYTLGKFDKAYELGQRLLRAPDRVGMTSTSRELRQLIAVVEYHAALEAFLEAERERASARPLGQRISSFLRRQRLRHGAWTARRRAARLLAGKVKLRHLVRPYFTPLVPWNTGALIAVAGEGVTLSALAAARSGEKMKQARPYFDALEAEVAHRAAEPVVAHRLAKRALTGLPKDEVLLRGRTEAIAAAAAMALGRHREAEALFHQVLGRFPTALRILGLQLPVRVRSGQDAFSKRVAKTLLRSPRLTDGAAFTVRVITKGSTTRVCLESNSGRRYACAEKYLAREIKNKVSEDERVALVVDEFHKKVFAPKIDLTQRDINSLDGSAVRGDADELLEKVLGQ